MAVPRILSQLADAARKADSPNLPKGRDLNKTFKPKSAKVPNVAGQGKVRKPRTQILIENYRSNPNGVRNQFLSLPEDVQMNILQEIAEDFPPSRTGEPISNVGQELYQFLTEGDGIADSPTRREVLMRDNRDAMRPGPSTSRGESFVTGEGRNKKFGSTGDERGDQFTELEIDDYLDNPEPEGIVDSSVGADNPQNRYSKPANDAASLGFTKKRLGEQESFRGNERFADVEDGQPTNKAIPGTGRKSDSADMEVSPAGQEYAQGQIDKNADPKYADMVAEKDNSSYFDSYQKGIVGMMNNSRNPDSLGGNRIDQLWGLISKTGDDPRTMFGSAEAMADVMLGHVNPKMVDNMANPSPIGQQLPAGQRSQMSYDLIKEQLVKQINQKYGDGWGAASAADLGKADNLEADGVNDLDAELDAVTPVDGLDEVPASQRDFRDDYNPVGPREEPSGAPPDSAKDRMMSAERNQQERFDLYQERLDELMNEEGLTVEEAVEMMEYEGMGQDFLQAGIDDVGRVERFGIPRENDGLGFSRYGNKGPKKPGPPLSVRAAKEKKIGAKGPQRTAEQAPTLKKENPDDVAINERANITRENEGQSQQFTEEELQRISRNEAHVDGGKVVDGPPPKDVGPEEGAKTGDLNGTSEGDQLDSLESSATDLPDDGKPTDTKPKDTKPKGNEGKPDSTNDKGNDGSDGSGEEEYTYPYGEDRTPNGDKTNDTTPGFLGKGSTSRKVATAVGSTGVVGMTLLGLAGLNRQGLKPAGNGPEGAGPDEGGSTGAKEPARPAGMAPNGGLERDADGTLSEAGMKLLLQKMKGSRGINTGTQTMGNWVR